MLIVLNGFPGVGKLTIARELARAIDGKLLDVHTEYNLAFALTEFRSELFYETIRKVWAVSDPLIAELPKSVPVILTTVMNARNPDDGGWGEESWNRMSHLGKQRAPFVWINIQCEERENIRRIQSDERRVKSKPRDPEMAKRNQAGLPLYDGTGSQYAFELDVTHLSPDAAALEIQRQLQPVQ